ncbi:MAG: glycosyltransferase 36 [Pseudomonadota bacterium]
MIGNAPAQLLTREADGARLVLHSPTASPRASAFLWNRRMLLQVNCRGYVTAQFLQPEPSKYSHAPFLEAQTFMQPEQPHYAHHPGRYMLFRDEETGARWSLPHEPLRRLVEDFRFSVEPEAVSWQGREQQLTMNLQLELAADEVLELWSLSLENRGDALRSLSIYPCFSIGYMSWMNQSAAFDAGRGALIARSVTPYQKLEALERVLARKDLTFLAPERAPDGWDASLEAFEGEGGWHAPSALDRDTLSGSTACYETPLAALQYRITLPPGGTEQFRFLFGPAQDEAQIDALKSRWFSGERFSDNRRDNRASLAEGKGCLTIETPDRAFDGFANHWLDRQVWYHGQTHRLTTDPQTRNFLQDAMGMVYLAPAHARAALLHALAQQQPDGGMPEGVLLGEQAELKYINQVPHMDHASWLPVCLDAYLDETDDLALLETPVTSQTDGRTETVFERIDRSLQWLLDHRDERGLSLVAQGDWCDPLNMAGHKGAGVSTWLTLATLHAVQKWMTVSRRLGHEDSVAACDAAARALADAIQTHCWDGEWFSRGLTDEGRAFGVRSDEEGRLWLNPQSWALMTGLATPEQQGQLLAAIDRELATPWGAQMLAPAFTAFRDDVGRITQKFPGSAENGSIYNHACAFYIHALYRCGEPERAWKELRKMLPGNTDEDLVRRGQLPAFVPNYYRGAVDLHPRTAGRSSQLFNTGTASWLYRILVEDLFGLCGCAEGLRINPSLPQAWREARVERRFRGAVFEVHFQRDAKVMRQEVHLEGASLDRAVVTDFEAGRRYRVAVMLPEGSS